MNRKMKGLLIGIGVVIVISILLGAYFASQPKVKWWKPAAAMEKPDVDFSKLNSTIVFIRTAQDNKSLYLVGGNESSDGKFTIYSYLRVKDFIAGSDISLFFGNFTVWAERLSGDYILQKLVIRYDYENDENISLDIPVIKNRIASTNLWFDATPNPTPNYMGETYYYDWLYKHVLIGVNKDRKNENFYGVSFALQINIGDSISQHLSHTIIFTVTAYYGHPSLLGWSDMHELKTQVVLKIVAEG